MEQECIILSTSEARKLIQDALSGSGLLQKHSEYFTEAILDTELSGLEGHGFYWLQYYCAHMRSGKVDGSVLPHIETISKSSFRIDARHGFAHPAIEEGFKFLIPAAKSYGVAAMSICNSYNAATLGFHTGFLARAGLLGIGATNAVPNLAPVGGKIPIIGTNPFSYAVPAPKGKIAFLVDQSATQVAWTAIKRAADAGENIPLGWALDTYGIPTQNAQAGLDGSMAPSGGSKGFNMGLFVEVLCSAVAGGKLGPEQGSFTEDDGIKISNGQFFIAIDPNTFAKGTFDNTIKKLVTSIIEQEGSRLPNARRESNKKKLGKSGLKLETQIYKTLKGFA